MADRYLLESSAVDGYLLEDGSGVLILEPAPQSIRPTNLLADASDFNTSSWTKSDTTVTANAATAPDGTVTADKLVESATTATHHIYQFGGNPTTPWTAWCFVCAKSGERSRISLGEANLSGNRATFDLSNGTVPFDSASTATIKPLGAGWYLCGVRAGTENLGNPAKLVVGLNTSSGTDWESYAGDGTSGVYLWGASLEDAILFRNAQTLYAPTVVPGAKTLTPSLLTNSQTFYAPTVTPGAVTLAPSLLTNTQTFYAPTVSQGGSDQSLTVPLLTNTQTFYSPSVTAGAVTLAPSLLTNTQTFYAATVTAGAVTLSPSLLTNAQTFYAPTVTPGSVTLTPALLTNDQTFYSATVTQDAGGQTLFPSLLSNAQTFYSATITTGAVTLLPTLLTNEAVFFAPTVTRDGDVPVVQTYSGEVDIKRWYVRRGKKIHVFDSAHDADAWLEAEAKAQQAIDHARSTSKQASRKRKQRTYKALDEVVSHQVIRLDELEAQLKALAIPEQINGFVSEQNWAEVARIALLAQQIQQDIEARRREDDDLAVLLLLC
jgi:hypothetical protein